MRRPLLVGALALATLLSACSHAASPPPGKSRSAGITTPAGYTGPPVTVLLVGDSTATTLAPALQQTESRYHAVLVDGSTFMCGVAIGAESSSDNGRGPTMAMVPACNSATPPDQQWPALWQKKIARYHPQVVALLAGRWETTDRTYQGKWMNIEDAPFAAYVARQLALAISIGTSNGAHMDLLTTACADSAPLFASMHKPDTAVEDDSPARLAIYNRLLREAAAGNPAVSIVDFDAILCPGGNFHRYLDGVQVRPLDGVHTPSTSPSNPFIDNSSAPVAAAFARWIGPRLWPKLLAPVIGA